jgi:hypothetical protein
MQTTTLLTTALFLALTAFTPMHNPPKVKDYLSLPRSLMFDSTAFKLAWSSHPNDNYYIQEYVPDGEIPEHFNRMMIVTAVAGDITVRDAVGQKVEELKRRKETDPTINYEIIDNPNTGEYLLDFIVSASENGETTIVEWNAYRYFNLKNKSGKDGILMVAYSRRAYGDDIESFLLALKTRRPDDIRKMTEFEVPNIRLAK